MDFLDEIWTNKVDFSQFSGAQWWIRDPLLFENTGKENFDDTGPLKTSKLKGYLASLLDAPCFKEVIRSALQIPPQLIYTCLKSNCRGETERSCRLTADHQTESVWVRRAALWMNCSFFDQLLSSERCSSVYTRTTFGLRVSSCAGAASTEDMGAFFSTFWCEILKN